MSTQPTSPIDIRLFDPFTGKLLPGQEHLDPVTGKPKELPVLQTRDVTPMSEPPEWLLDRTDTRITKLDGQPELISILICNDCHKTMKVCRCGGFELTEHLIWNRAVGLNELLIRQLSAAVEPTVSPEQVASVIGDIADTLATETPKPTNGHKSPEILTQLTQTPEPETNTPQKTLLDYALDCVRRGWYVIPCYPKMKIPAGEVVPHGLSEASNDEAVVRRWWERNPNYNPAVVLGPSNLVVYDFDSIKPFDYLPQTFTVKSGRIEKDGVSGIHMYYSGSCRTHGHAGGGGEVRSRGAYVMAVGAVHPDGNPYVVIANHDLGVSPEQNEDVSKPAVPAIGTDDQNTIAAYVEDAFDISGIDYQARVEHEGGFKWFIACPWKQEHTTGKDFDTSSAVIMWSSGKLIYECKHSHCQGIRQWKRLRSWMQSTTGFVFPFGVDSDEPTASTPPPIEAEEIVIDENDPELEKEYPRIALPVPAGPEWSDDILFGIAGDVTRKAAEYSEAHPAGIYLDFIVSIGNLVGRGPYFNVNSTRHYTNENVIRIGDTSKARKGTGRDIIDGILKILDPEWFDRCVASGFCSPEAIIRRIRDDKEHALRDKKKGTVILPPMVIAGIKDKRLFVREGEIASIFVMANKPESRASVVLRDGWDGKPLNNEVKGAGPDGVNNSEKCREPHLSISADTTRNELVKTMPDGSAENGFANRFLYCYVYRTQLCPYGGPEIDWGFEIEYFREVVKFAREQRYVPLTEAAKKVWIRMYPQIENSGSGRAANMTSRGAAHVRRLALILALIDMQDVVATCHLHAAKKLWDYCEQSAEFVFNRYTRDQLKILHFIEQKGTTSLAEIREELFKRHKLADWIKSQVIHLSGQGCVILSENEVKFVKK